MIEILFFKPHSFLGNLQTWWTGRKFSHVALRTSISGRTVIAHSMPESGIILTAPAYTHTPSLVFPLPWADEGLIAPWLLERLGNSYGWREAAAFVLPLGQVNTPGQTCSEFVANAIAFLADQSPISSAMRSPIGMSFSSPWAMLPDDVYDALEQLCKF